MNVDERIVAILKVRDDLLKRLAPIIYGELLEYEDTYEVAEEICAAAFGKRVRCPECGTLVFPGFLCLGCEEWTAPEGVS